MRSFTTAPTAEEIRLLAEEALAALPVVFLRHLGNVAILVEDFADDDTLDAMDIEDPFELTGLYQGVDLGRKSVMDVPAGPDMIFLYRRPLLDEWCETGVDLKHLVRHVLIHEIGHHYGYSDEDMERIEASTED